MRHILTTICLFALCALLQGAARVDAIVDKNVLPAGEVLRLQLQITDDEAGNNPPQMVMPKFPSDFPFQTLRQIGPTSSTQSSMQIINGNVSQSRIVTQTMIFLLKPKSAGNLEIPELQITYGNNKLRTKSIKIQVSDAQSSQRQTNSSNNRQQTAATQVAPIFTQEFSDENIIAGTPLTLTLTLLIPEQMNARNISPEFNLHDLESDFRVDRPEDIVHWGELPTQIINGIRYRAIGKEIRITPRRPGKITLPPKAMTVIYRDPSASRRRGGFFDDIFDDPFFGGGQNLETTVASEEATLNVLDFPEDGKPANFSGLIGPLTTSATIDLPEAQVGDPITLTITLAGDYVNPGDSLPTDIKTQLEQKGLFRVSGDDTFAELEDASFSCTRTIRALSDKATEIPSIQIPFFNIKTGSYDVAATKAIPIEVEATREVTLKDSGMSTPQIAIQTLSSAQKETALTRQEGIQLESDATLAAGNEWSPLADNSGKKGLLWYFVAPALLWIVAAIATLLHKHGKRLSPAELASRNAFRDLKASLAQIDGKSSDDAVSLNAALQEFLAARLGKKGAVTADELSEANVNPATAEALRELLSQCEAAQYGGLSIPTAELKERILSATRNF